MSPWRNNGQKMITEGSKKFQPSLALLPSKFPIHIRGSLTISVKYRVREERKTTQRKRKLFGLLIFLHILFSNEARKNYVTEKYKTSICVEIRNSEEIIFVLQIVNDLKKPYRGRKCFLQTPKRVTIAVYCKGQFVTCIKIGCGCQPKFVYT